MTENKTLPKPTRKSLLDALDTIHWQKRREYEERIKEQIDEFRANLEKASGLATIQEKLDAMIEAIPELKDKRFRLAFGNDGKLELTFSRDYFELERLKADIPENYRTSFNDPEYDKIRLQLLAEYPLGIDDARKLIEDYQNS